MSVKKRRRLIFGVAILVAVLITFYFSVRAKNYDIQYSIKDYSIEEAFLKEEKYYSFSVELDGVKYVMNVANKYLHKKKLIVDIDVLETSEAKCVLLKSDKFSTYPVCLKNEQFVDYDLLNERDEAFYKRDDSKKSGLNYEGIEFYNTLDKNYLIWDHKGYYYISRNDQRRIEFLNKDTYQNTLAYGVSKYVITPNYDEDYVVNKFFVIDISTGKLSEWNLEEEISNNYYYLGDVDGKIYMVDRKNRKEYSLDPAKKKIEQVDRDEMGRIYSDGWENVSMTKLVSADYAFNREKAYSFNLDDRILKVKLAGSKDSILVTDKEVDKIVASRNEEVFYLVGDVLYNYSLLKGEAEVLKYSELNFNNTNSIFVY